jgi:predicted alpha/beta superfamily hydrolase
MATWKDYRKTLSAGEHTVVGAVKMLPSLPSPLLDCTRDIYVYLPPSYKQGGKYYPVLYMHDGQNLFDQASSYAGEWQVDETMESLSQEGLEAIVVGIPNGGERRYAEYTPFEDLLHAGGDGDKYLQFLTEIVKPRVDQDFRTLPNREHTGVLGSSLGGLISLYAYFRYPDTFSFAGALSPAFWPAAGQIFPYVEAAPFVPGKIYLDVGTREVREKVITLQLQQAINKRYVEIVRKMRDLLVAKGYNDLVYVEEPYAVHHEKYWARRLPVALRFFLS